MTYIIIVMTLAGVGVNMLLFLLAQHHLQVAKHVRQDIEEFREHLIKIASRNGRQRKTR